VFADLVHRVETEQGQLSPDHGAFSPPWRIWPQPEDLEPLAIAPLP